MVSDEDLQRVSAVISAVRANPPLIHCLCNSVVEDIVANGLLAAGAQPVMTETIEEAPYLTRAASAVLVNVGTLSHAARESMPACAKICDESGKPWVLDPVGVGAAPARTELCRQLLGDHPSVIRGNASEILALADEQGAGRGVDSGDSVEDARGAAERLVALTSGVVAVSGPMDLIVEDGQSTRLSRGHALLGRVTGTGCLLGALTAACLASTDDHFLGALAATTWLTIAGERAAELAAGPGSFRMHLLDQLDAVGVECE